MKRIENDLVQCHLLGRSSRRAARFAVVAAALLPAATAAPAAAQCGGAHHAPPPAAAPAPTVSPYVGLENREVKVLSAERRAGLLAGAGLGYGLAAELNGHAGPKHVLELADELALTAEQRAGAEGSMERMRVEAVELGAEIVAAEEELDRRFAHRHLDQARLAELTARIAELEGRLRFVHLRAHLETDEILTAAQRSIYLELRGYAAPSDGGQGAADHEAHARKQDGGA